MQRPAERVPVFLGAPGSRAHRESRGGPARFTANLARTGARRWCQRLVGKYASRLAPALELRRSTRSAEEDRNPFSGPMTHPHLVCGRPLALQRDRSSQDERQARPPLPRRWERRSMCGCGLNVQRPAVRAAVFLCAPCRAPQLERKERSGTAVVSLLRCHHRFALARARIAARNRGRSPISRDSRNRCVPILCDARETPERRGRRQPVRRACETRPSPAAGRPLPLTRE